jgi:hypothetical protein
MPGASGLRPIRFVESGLVSPAAKLIGAFALLVGAALIYPTRLRHDRETAARRLLPDLPDSRREISVRLAAVTSVSRQASLAFIFFAAVAGLLGHGVVTWYRQGEISRWRQFPKVLRYRGAPLPDLKWRLRKVTYRRATEPIRYWLSLATFGFGCVCCSLAAGLALYAMIQNW